jgi:hypothetical protein
LFIEEKDIEFVEKYWHNRYLKKRKARRSGQRVKICLECAPIKVPAITYDWIRGSYEDGYDIETGRGTSTVFALPNKDFWVNIARFSFALTLPKEQKIMQYILDRVNTSVQRFEEILDRQGKLGDLVRSFNHWRSKGNTRHLFYYFVLCPEHQESRAETLVRVSEALFSDEPFYQKQRQYGWGFCEHPKNKTMGFSSDLHEILRYNFSEEETHPSLIGERGWEI